MTGGTTASARICVCAAALIAFISVVAANTATAQSAADTYRGKTLRILIPGLPGGGRMLYVFPFAARFGEHIPGYPAVVPTFMPGAGGSNAVNNAYSVAAPDGLTIVSPLTGVVEAQAIGDESVRYDVTKFNWIGRITDATRVLFISTRVKARTLADLRDREVVIGAVGRASETYLSAAFINKVFGAKFKIVTGYASAGKMNMAVDSGEVEGAISSWNDITTYHPDWLRDDKVRVIVQIALTKHPDLPEVPLLVDLAGNDADRDMTAFMSSSTLMGQSFAAPPDVPAPIVAALRQAFDDTMADPAFTEKMKASKIRVNPMGGAELARNVARTINVSRSVIEGYKAAVSGEER